MDTSSAPSINNSVYETLGDEWYGADDNPVALLRAESRVRNPWVLERLGRRFSEPIRVLDVGCGGGFLSNFLALHGHRVTGLDASGESLTVAARHDSTRSVRYELGDALHLPYPNASFEAVCAMDFLEHVEDAARVVAEAARVLRPGGLFFFHTFNRNPLAWLVVIKGVEWFVKNTPKDLHVLRLFIRPEELSSMCKDHELEILELAGSAPVLSSAFFQMLATGVVPKEFSFKYTRSTRLAYTGYAERLGAPLA